MKLTKLAAVLGFSCLMVAGSAFAEDPVEPITGGHGQITFEGEIIDAPCSIAPNNDKQTVQLGQVSSSLLKGGGRSTSEAFTIKLENCSTKTYKTVEATFSGLGATGIDNAIAIDGTAKGAGVIISQYGGNIVKLGEATSPAQVLSEGPNELRFSAYLQGKQGVDVTPGTFSSIATFALTYK